MTPTPVPAVVELAPAASQWLDVLVEAGHLDAARLESLSDRLLDVEPEGGVITLQQLRRHTAELLFDSMTELDAETRRVFQAEWPQLFY